MREDGGDGSEDVRGSMVAGEGVRGKCERDGEDGSEGVRRSMVEGDGRDGREWKL